MQWLDSGSKNQTCIRKHEQWAATGSTCTGLEVKQLIHERYLCLLRAATSSGRSNDGRPEGESPVKKYKEKRSLNMEDIHLDQTNAYFIDHLRIIFTLLINHLQIVFKLIVLYDQLSKTQRLFI